MSDFRDDDAEQAADRSVIPTHRVYVHTLCGGHTATSGAEFVQLTDPFLPCTATFCSQCRKMALLTDVSWSATGESVIEYRSRVRAEAPTMVRVWRYCLGLLPAA